MNDFILDKAALSEEEKQEILAALQSLNAAKDINQNAILSKLSTILNVDSASWLAVDFSRWGNRKKKNISLKTILSIKILVCKSILLRKEGVSLI